LASSSRPALSAEDDAKLIFGTVFSLRNMVRKLGGEDDRYDTSSDFHQHIKHHLANQHTTQKLTLCLFSFLSYRTSQYKLHYYETPSNTKFVMLTDTKAPSMRIALHQIWVNIYVEFVVKNPLSPIEHPGGLGVNNELFEASLEQFVVRWANRLAF
jgi:trafficking protein particle complex subunit 1